MTQERIHVLLIDDDPDYAAIMERQLSRMSSCEVEYRHAPSAVEGLGLLHQWDADVVFIDYWLGQENGIEVLSQIRSLGDSRAIILITGDGSEDVAARAFREGADDYISKSDVNPESLQRSIGYARGQCERRNLASELEHTARRLGDANRALAVLAREDELTGLCTRRYFNQRLGQELTRAERFQQPLSLLFIDVDHFKQINDQHGHAIGDQVLQAVGRRIRERLRGSDLGSRYGGDEFCVLLVENGLEGGLCFGERLAEEIRELRFEIDSLRVTASIGVADHRRGELLEALLERADAALYEAKRAGRDGVSGPPSSDANAVGASADRGA